MSRTKIALIIAPVALLFAACSSPSTPASSHTSHPVTAATQSTVPPAATSTAASAGLSGTWNGQYSGSFSGTFSLTWQQSGSSLTGTINLPQAGGTTAINGTVTGGSISFGTVGSQAITYSGSVTGSSMSGSYHVANGATGSWSAAKA